MQLLNDEYFSNNVEKESNFIISTAMNLTNQILCNIWKKKNGEKNRYLLFYHVITARNPFKILAKKEFFLYIESFEFSSWYWDILIFEDISIRIKMLNFHTIVNQINPNPDIYSCVLLMVGWGLFCPHITTVTSHEPAYSKQRHLLEIIYKYN